MKNVERIIRLYKDGKIDDTTMVKMAVFKEKVAELIKESGPGGLTKNQVLMAAAISAGIGLGSQAIESLSNYFVTTRAQKQLDETTKKIFEDIYNSPEVKSFPREVAEQYFNTLKHFSPHVASDPLAAKTYLLQMLKWSDEYSAPISTMTVRDLAEVENKAMDALNKRPLAGPNIGKFTAPIVESIQKAPKNLYTEIKETPQSLQTSMFNEYD